MCSSSCLKNPQSWLCDDFFFLTSPKCREAEAGCAPLCGERRPGTQCLLHVGEALLCGSMQMHQISIQALSEMEYSSDD